MMRWINGMARLTVAIVAATLWPLKGTSYGSKQSPATSVQELALAADNECLTDETAPVGTIEFSTGSLAKPACGLSVLQFRGQKAAMSDGENYWEVLQRTFGPSEDLGPYVVVGAGIEAGPWNQSYHGLRSENMLDDMILKTLLQKRDAINGLIQNNIPDVMVDPFVSTFSKHMCCTPLPWGCLCHCEASGDIRVANLSNANTFHIMNFTTVTSKVNEGIYTVRAKGSVTDLACAGTVQGTATSCAVGPLNVGGGLSFMVSMNVHVAIEGSFIPATDDVGGLCFKITHVKLTVPGSSVRYKHINMSIGRWHFINIQSDFWVQVVNHIPSNFLIGTITPFAQSALVKALARQDLCF